MSMQPVVDIPRTCEALVFWVNDPKMVLKVTTAFEQESKKTFLESVDPRRMTLWMKLKRFFHILDFNTKEISTIAQNALKMTSLQKASIICEKMKTIDKNFSVTVRPKQSTPHPPSASLQKKTVSGSPILNTIPPLMRGDMRIPKIGSLCNHEYYCYRNAILAALWGSKAFREILLKICQDKGTPSSAHNLATILSRIDKGEKQISHFSDAILKELDKEVNKKSEDISSSGQKDANEFFGALSRVLFKKGTIQTKDKKVFSTDSSITAEEEVVQSFLQVNPTYCGASESRSLQTFFTEYTSEYQESDRLPAGKYKNTITLTGTPPSFLPINIGRFLQTKTATGIQLSKDTTPIKIPETLTVAVLLPSGEKKQAQYRLQSAVIHHGNSLSRGHYTAFVRYGDNGWMHVDDVGENEVIHGVEVPKAVDEAATTCFYALVPSQ